jgi:hypothetical protein
MNPPPILEIPLRMKGRAACPQAAVGAVGTPRPADFRGNRRFGAQPLVCLAPPRSDRGTPNHPDRIVVPKRAQSFGVGVTHALSTAEDPIENWQLPIGNR